MTITLSPDQIAWLQAHVQQGDFASIEAAARQLIDERISERMANAGNPQREVLLAGELSDILRMARHERT